jgi:mannose/fructose/N-acetylgalactosamine-specific phosphotransferase system component IIC
VTAIDMMGGFTGAHWALLGWLALLSGLLALDDTALGQTWLSQPLPAAALAGLVCGQPLLGLAVGLPLQLALVMNLPVGQTVTGDASAGAVAAVGGAILAGKVPAALGGFHGLTEGAPRGDLALTGWLLLGAALWSLGGHPLIQAERRLHLIWMLQGRRTLRDGNLSRVERIHGRCLAATLVRGVLYGGVGVLAMAGLWVPAFDALPAGLRGAMAWVPVLASALGVGAVLERYGVGRHWRWVGAGAVAGWALGVLT